MTRVHTYDSNGQWWYAISPAEWWEEENRFEFLIVLFTRLDDFLFALILFRFWIPISILYVSYTEIHSWMNENNAECIVGGGVENSILHWRPSWFVDFYVIEPLNLAFTSTYQNDANEYSMNYLCSSTA